MGDPWEQSPFHEPAAVGEAANGRLRVELDATGRVSNILLDQAVASLPLPELREAIIAAFQQAQDAARTNAEQVADRRYGGLAPRERLEAVAADASAAADRRFAEISTVLHDLDRRAEHEW